jgi:hypothetical protein
MAWRNYPPYMAKQTKSKYGAEKITVDGQSFASKKEARRFTQLRLLERAGEISDLKTQVKFVLIPAQRDPDTVGARGGVKKGKLIERECAYIADFVYKDNQGETVVEDVKGYKGGGAYELFKIKRKLMLYVHGIRIIEI